MNKLADMVGKNVRIYTTINSSGHELVEEGKVWGVDGHMLEVMIYERSRDGGIVKGVVPNELTWFNTYCTLLRRIQVLIKS